MMAASACLHRKRIWDHPLRPENIKRLTTNIAIDVYNNQASGSSRDGYVVLGLAEHLLYLGPSRNGVFEAMLSSWMFRPLEARKHRPSKAGVVQGSD